MNRIVVLVLLVVVTFASALAEEPAPGAYVVTAWERDNRLIITPADADPAKPGGSAFRFQFFYREPPDLVFDAEVASDHTYHHDSNEEELTLLFTEDAAIFSEGRDTWYLSRRSGDPGTLAGSYSGEGWGEIYVLHVTEIVNGYEFCVEQWYYDGDYVIPTSDGGVFETEDRRGRALQMVSRDGAIHYEREYRDPAVFARTFTGPVHFLLPTEPRWDPLLPDLSSPSESDELFQALRGVPLPPSAGVGASQLSVAGERYIELAGAQVRSLSPDGKLILGNGRDHVVISRLGASDQVVRIASPGGLRDPAGAVWSPDSSRIAFTDNYFLMLLEPDIHVVDVVSGALFTVTPDGVDRLPFGDTSMTPVDLTPVFLADSRTILFQRYAGPGIRVVRFATVDDTGERVTALTHSLATIPSIVDLAISHVTGDLYYTNMVVGTDDPDGGIWTLKPGTSTPIQLVSNLEAGRGTSLIQHLSYTGQHLLIIFPDLLRGRLPDADIEAVGAPIALFDLAHRTLVEMPHDSIERRFRTATLSPDGSKLLYIYENEEGVSLAVRDVTAPRGRVGDAAERQLISVGGEVVLFTSQDRSLGVSSYSPLRSMAGLDWAANDRVLILADGGFRALVVELAVD